MTVMKIKPTPDTCEDVVCPKCRAKIGLKCYTKDYWDSKMPEVRLEYHTERIEKSNAKRKRMKQNARNRRFADAARKKAYRASLKNAVPSAE